MSWKALLLLLLLFMHPEHVQLQCTTVWQWHAPGIQRCTVLIGRPPSEETCNHWILLLCVCTDCSNPLAHVQN